MRPYNRISVFLSFFALLAVALWLDGMVRRHATSTVRRIATGLALGAAVVLALCDQNSPMALPDYNQIRAEFINDATFVQEIERRVPRGGLIFQFLFMPFHESAPVGDLPDYDLLRGYLHSDHLRWSYGDFRNMVFSVRNFRLTALA